ncbi:hypothetical protein EJ110_NYTH28869 [Nymphaea thermarum]|nr:hypothetical protein EJ110_NYTH28869 [Nymphaea thermarum]
MASAYEWMAPPAVRHPAHPCKPLSLVQMPPTPDLVRCNACSFPISGFSYNCGSYNLHPYCAGISLHLYIQHPHLPGPPHLATLMFFPPYQNGQFTCNICRKWGGSHWLYRCTVCNDFDAHLGCAMNAAQLQFQVHPQYNPPTTPVYPPYNSGGGGSTAYASTPSSDPGKKFGKCMWAVVRLADLALGTGGLIDLGSSLFNNMDLLSGAGSLLSF